jgi:4'-phosphopantetheinyl transferase
VHQPAWKEQPLESSLPLAEDEVHVWRLDLDGPPQPLDLLSAAERERHGGFRHARAAWRYLNTRGLTRRILAAYLGQAAASLNMATAEGGKPYLPDHELEFNLSHSHGLGLLAVGRQPLGVDLEQLRPVRYPERIATRMFGAETAAMLQNMSDRDSQRLFFSRWTVMEARQKAMGRGIFEQQVSETETSCRQFIPRDGFIAAIATVETNPPRLKFLKPA